VSESFDLSEVSHFVCGTIGTPGQRVFHLQVEAGGENISFRLEKQQVAVLCDYLERILATHDVPESAPAHMRDLEEPVIDQWTIGSMMVAINDTAGKVIVIVEELDEDEDDPELEPAQARFALTRGQVEAFVDGARRVVEGGRPICRLCGRPMDPDGHPCPRLN
jgi:uncharacterized repeat protein (TIGR03847 family)